MKLKLIAALLGLMIALPGAVIAQDAPQNPDDQAQQENSKPSPNVQMQSPNDQGSADQNPALNQNQDQNQDQDMNQPPMVGPNDPGANDAGPGAPTSTAPAPDDKNGVARISLIHGDVSTQRGDSKDWSAAAVNAPVLAGDRVSTGDKARTEIQLDYANLLRLAEHSQANIVQLNRSQIQIQLGHGMANYTVLKNSDADAEIDTPNVAIRTERRESSFRILVTADDHTEVLVRKGEIEVTTPQGGTRVGQNQFITIQGSGADAQYKIGEAPARDDFDQWNSDRDNMIRNSVARRNTNDYYVGTQDLDGHGTWSEVPDYGPVWRPNEPAGWAPYRDGRWVYEPYWGWTWVSYDPWGWAPYHYGRWMYVNGGWGWWPGPAYGYPYYRPIWAPAYVSFYGFGVGFGFGFGFGWGNVGWLPLGPCDHFHPWYGHYGGGYGAVGYSAYNRGGFAPLHGGTRFSNVNLAMHDPNFRGGTTVSGKEFGTGHMSTQPMSHAQFQNARFTTGKLPMTPSRESYSASGHPAAASTTRNVAQNQHFFSVQGTSHGATTASNNRSIGNSHEVARPANSGSNGGFQRPNQTTATERSTETRNISNSASAPRPGYSGNSTTARESGSSNGGWQKFTPMPARPSSESGRTSESARSGESASRGSTSSMGRSTEQRGPYGSSSSRSMGSDGRSYGGSSRPPLNMRQPIVMPRSYGGGAYGGSPYGGRPAAPSYGGRPAAPSYGGPRSAPSYGGSHSAPSSHSSAPSHGGGSSHSGGSSHGGGGGRHGR